MKPGGGRGGRSGAGAKGGKAGGGAGSKSRAGKTPVRAGAAQPAGKAPFAKGRARFTGLSKAEAGRAMKRAAMAGADNAGDGRKVQLREDVPAPRGAAEGKPFVPRQRVDGAFGDKLRAKRAADVAQFRGARRTGARTGAAGSGTQAADAGSCRCL